MMPGERPNQPIPDPKEAAQYITYSAKELMHVLNDKIDKIDDKVDRLNHEFAKLPAVYVTQKAVDEAKRESVVAVRFAVASAIASVGALGTFLGILFA